MVRKRIYTNRHRGRNMVSAPGKRRKPDRSESRAAKSTDRAGVAPFGARIYSIGGTIIKGVLLTLTDMFSIFADAAVRLFRVPQKETILRNGD